MELINSQYKIEKIKEEKKFGSKLIVQDIHRGNLKKNMCIIDLSSETSEFIEYMKKNFFDYINFSHPNISKFYYFNRIRAINTKLVQANRFYYTYEYFDGIPFLKYIKDKDTDTILETIRQLCSALKYYHLRGFLLCSLNPEDIYLIDEFASPKVKISTFPFPNSIDDSVIINQGDSYFISSKAIQNRQFDLENDIYILGMIIYHAFFDTIPLDLDIQNISWDKYRQKDSNKEKIKSIIKKCIYSNTTNAYNSVDEVMKDINYQFKRDYKIIYKSYLETLPSFTTKLIGRENFIKSVLKNIQSRFEKEGNKKATIVMGGFGTGKNTLLDVLLTRIMYEGEYATYNVLNKDEDSDYYGITSIIKRILKYLDKDTIEKYSVELGKVIPGMDPKDNKREFLYFPKEEDEVYRITYRLGNFLIEASLERSFVIVIKDYDNLDIYSKKIINYLLANQNKGNIYFILSLDQEVPKEDVYKILLPQLKESEIEFIVLSNFSIDETRKVITILLGIDKPSIEFSAMIYEKTQGNPYFIYELINILIKDKHIFVDDKGEWVLDELDYNAISLSTNVDEFWKNKIEKLDLIQKEILNIMSIFTTAVSIDIIRGMLNIDMSILVPMIDNLINVNLLSLKLDDWGMSYDYKSSNLKRNIYESLGEPNRFEYHKKATSILEEKFKEEGRENKDELIYHMSKSGKHNEAVIYLIELSKRFIKNNLHNQAVQFLSRGFSIANNNDLFEKRLEISFNLGFLYFQLGEYDKSHEFYNLAKNDAIKLKDDKFLIDIYIKMIILCYRESNIVRALEYSRKAKKEIKRIGYETGMLDLIIAISDILIYRRKFNSPISIVSKVLKTVDKEDKYYYGTLMSIYGRALANKGLFKEAEHNLKISVETLKELGDSEGLISAINSLGMIYVELYNDIEKSKECFKEVLDMCQRVSNIPYMLYGYNSLGEIHRIQGRFKESLDCYNRALGLVKRSRNVYIESYLHINIANVRMQTEDYNEYLRIMDTANTIISDNKDSGEAEKFYYINEALFHYKMGDYKKAKECAKKSIDKALSWGGHPDIEAFAIEKLCDIKLDGDMDLYGLRTFCYDAFNDKQYLTCKQISQSIAELYIQKEKKDEAKVFLEIADKCKDFLNNEYLNMEHDYLSSMLLENKDRSVRLKGLEHKVNSFENNEMKSKFYFSLGSTFYDMDDCQGALEAYIKSFNFLRMLAYEVPKEYKYMFLLSHNRHMIKEKIINLSKQIINSEDSSIYEIENSIEESYIDNKSLKTSQEDLKKHYDKALSNDGIADIEGYMHKYFDYKVFKDLLRDIKSYRYKSHENREWLKSNKYLFQLLKKIGMFSEDIEENINVLMVFLKDLLQAKNVFLSIIDENSENRMLFSEFQDKKDKFYRFITEKVKQTSESIIIVDAFEHRKRVNDSVMPKEICSMFFIPIMPYDTFHGLDNRKKDNANRINGFLYFDTDTIINNFTDNTADLCIEISKIAYILLENYNLRTLTAIDKLTRLYTRKYFENSMQKEIINATIENREFSIVMMDLDRFKSVNDRFGHQVGDEVLSKVAEIIMKSIRKTDICARYGGEEFILLLPHTILEDAFKIAEKIRKKIAASNLLDYKTITISMGVSAFPKHGTWMKDLIDKSDQALYYSKENGRNRTTVYDPNMEKSARRVDKLAGIVSGNMVEDMRNVETMIEMLDLQRDIDISLEDKLFNFLGRVIEVSEAKSGSIFLIDNDLIVKQIARKSMINEPLDYIPYNKELLMKCIETGKGEYVIDYDKDTVIDVITGMPNWQSKMLVPIKEGGIIHGVLYLATFLKDKEYDADIYNFMKTLCKIIAPVFQGDDRIIIN